MEESNTIRASASTIVEDGIGAGILGGLAMAVFMMGYAATVMGDMWAPLRMIGATFYGPQALVSGSGVVLWGLIVHLVVASILGVIFTWIVGARSSNAASLGLGALYGLFVMFVMTYLVLPWSDPTMYARVPMFTGAWIVGHMVYGGVMGILSSSLVTHTVRVAHA